MHEASVQAIMTNTIKCILEEITGKWALNNWGILIKWDIKTPYAVSPMSLQKTVIWIQLINFSLVLHNPSKFPPYFSMIRIIFVLLCFYVGIQWIAVFDATMFMTVYDAACIFSSRGTKLSASATQCYISHSKYHSSISHQVLYAHALTWYTVVHLP